MASRINPISEISEDAKNGIDLIFARAARVSLARDAGDSVAVETMTMAQAVDTPHMLVLTVASYAFRLLTIFHFNDDGATREHFARGAAGRDFAEIVGEIGNLCCGAMNRELGEHFVHTGMSTPTLLSGACLPFLNELKPAHLARRRIVINGALTLHATLCLCAYAPIDFRVDPQIAAEATGELELF